VSAAFRADPELIGLPLHVGAGIAHVHLGAAPHAANVNADVAHAGDSSLNYPITQFTIAPVIPAVVLAAGLSTRMGRPKPLLPLPGGETFLSKIVRSFLEAGVDDVVVVLGHEADAVAAKLIESGVAARFVINEAYATGQLSSVLRGLNAIDRPGVRAMLLTLVDVPLVSPATIRAVIDRYQATHAPIVRPVRGDEHGHPVLIDRSLFGLVRSADSSAGIKPVVRAHVSAAGDVAVADAGAFVDIDTPTAYERVLNDTSTMKP
jgi:molybdenum cofactor cytidylyltransferase